MIKRLVAVLYVAAAAFALPFHGSAQDKFSVDKVVAVVGNSAIFYSDLHEMTEQIAADRLKNGSNSDQSARDQALEQLMMSKLLYNQALIDSVKINQEYLHDEVERQMTAMVSEAGSIVALEEREGLPYYDISGRLERVMEEALYANSMRYTVTQNVRITPSEVERFYNKVDKSKLPMVPEQYIYSQITKFPFNTSGAKQRARERLLEMRERIIGGEKFDMLARMYSVHPSAMKGGESEYLELDVHFKPFADVLLMLQPGQVSEVVETPDGLHIVEKLDQRGTAYKYRQILLKPVFTDEELLQADRFLDSLTGRILAGEITFGKAAQEHSDDKYSKENGGIVTNHEAIEVYMGNNPNIEYSSTKFISEELPQSDYYAIRALKPGEISRSYRSQDMRGGQLSKIVRLEQVIPTHTANLNDDYAQLEQAALSAKQEEVFAKWFDKKIESMYVKIAPEFSDADFTNKKWIK